MSGITYSTSKVTVNILPSGELYDVLLSGIKWGEGTGTAANLTYSFPYAEGVAYWSSSYSNEPASNNSPSGFSATQMHAAEQVLAQWASVANLTFTKVTESSTTAGDIRFAYSKALSISGAAAWANYPNFDASGGDVWLNPEYDKNNGENLHLLRHELGHALGLKHPFGDGTTLPTSQDSFLYTVMSYTLPPHHSFRNQLTGWDVIPENLMLYDIAAIQHIYGANISYKTGDDTYTFDPATPFFMTIWDAGGTDTISVSNFTKACSINLKAGLFSKITIESYPSPYNSDPYDGTDNLAIAFNVTIETATGGSGNDILTGNDAANILIGNAGNDQLDGGDGIDTAIYTSNRAAATITSTYSGLSITSAEGIDTLLNIERIKFSDTSIALDLSGNAGKTAKLLGSVFGVSNVANRGYAGIGIRLLDGGMCYEDLAALALNAAGATTPQQIVNLLWTKVVGSTPTAEQAQPFIDMLNNGMTSGQLGVLAADTALNQSNIKLVGLATTGLEYI